MSSAEPTNLFSRRSQRSIFAGQIAQVEFTERPRSQGQTNRVSRYLGRVQELVPIKDGETVVGVLLTLRRGHWKNGDAWVESDEVETLPLGPFNQINRVKVSVSYVYAETGETFTSTVSEGENSAFYLEGPPGPSHGSRTLKIEFISR